MTDEPIAPASRMDSGRFLGAFMKERLFLLLGAGVLVAVLLVLINILRSDVAWQLNLTAQTEIIDIELAGHTQWNIGNAVVCVRRPQSVTEHFAEGERVCGSRAWQALSSPDASHRRWLELTADDNNPVSVRLSTEANGKVHMALRRKEGSLGLLRSHQDESESQALPSGINAAWLPVTNAKGSMSVVLPFTGRTKVGHDVAWSVERMLRSGQLAIFAASEDALAGRTLAEESTLLLGDQVVLNGVHDKNKVQILPKGFVSFTPAVSDIGGVKTLDVVAFAPAQGVDIERYGGGKYSFRASWWVKLKHQSAVVIGVVLLTGFLSLISSLLSIFQALPDVKRWYANRSGEMQPGGQSRED